MSDRKEKLNRLLQSTSRRIVAGSPAERDAVTPVRAAAAVVPGDIPVRETIFPAGHCFGAYAVGQARPLHRHLLWLAGLPGELRPAEGRILFLDTETTGLSGGAGTYIFMAGLARFTAAGDQLAVRQYLLPDPSAERAFLQQIEAELAAGDVIVCFNGKSYDLPLLQTRFLLNGFPPRFASVPVIDLLHPARTLWKARLQCCDLQTLEQQVLGYLRPDDLPGALAPERYFRYLRRRDPQLLEDVFRHNRDDMLAMAALAAAMNRWLALNHAAEDEALACLVHYLDTHSRLAEFEQMLADHAGRLDQYARGHAVIGHSLANLYKRLGRRAEAYELFHHLTVTRPREVPEAMEEVLIYEEHHLRDFQGALTRCEHYLALVAAWPAADEWRERLEYRRRRLQRKLAQNVPPEEEE